MEYVLGVLALLLGIGFGWFIRDIFGPSHADVDVLVDRAQAADRRRDALRDEVEAEREVVAALRQALYDEQNLLNRVAESEGVEPEKFRASLAALYRTAPPSMASVERRISFEPDTRPVGGNGLSQSRATNDQDTPPLVRGDDLTEESTADVAEPDFAAEFSLAQESVVEQLRSDLAARDVQLDLARTEIQTIRAEVEALANAHMGPPASPIDDDSTLDLSGDDVVIDLSDSALGQQAERVAVTSSELRFLQDRLAASRVLENELMALRERVVEITLRNDELNRAAEELRGSSDGGPSREARQEIRGELESLAARLLDLGERLTPAGQPGV